MVYTDNSTSLVPQNNREETLETFNEKSIHEIDADCLQTSGSLPLLVYSSVWHIPR